jgi:hypothetical protein
METAPYPQHWRIGGSLPAPVVTWPSHGGRCPVYCESVGDVLVAILRDPVYPTTTDVVDR